MYTILIERCAHLRGQNVHNTNRERIAHLRGQNVHNTNREMCSFEGSKCTQY